MDIHEMDFRKDWLDEILTTLSQSFVNIDKYLVMIDWYDALFAKEQIEFILGVAYVAAQTYITGTVSDYNRITKGNIKKKYELLSVGDCCSEVQITKIKLVDSIANYFKHNDEWDEWEPCDRNRRTIDNLMVCGITENTEFPCYKAATLLWPQAELNELNNLLIILVDWREKLLKLA